MKDNVLADLKDEARKKEQEYRQDLR